jgi:hypothetical protein
VVRVIYSKGKRIVKVIVPVTIRICPDRGVHG